MYSNRRKKIYLLFYRLNKFFLSEKSIYDLYCYFLVEGFTKTIDFLYEFLPIENPGIDTRIYYELGYIKIKGNSLEEAYDRYDHDIAPLDSLMR